MILLVLKNVRYSSRGSILARKPEWWWRGGEPWALSTCGGLREPWGTSTALGLLSQSSKVMERFIGAVVMICRPAVVVSMLLLLSCSAQVPWAQADQLSNVTNIACGANQSYIDPVTGLTWVPDAPYISTGKTQANLPTPSSPANASGMASLRYFDDPRTKNCYTLPVNVSEYYMLRASFFYGNYDNAAQPPSFQLAIDGNIVANITMASDAGQYVEFQYSPGYNSTFLCLVRTSPLSTPFISGITLIEVTDYATQSEGFRNNLFDGYFMKTLTRVNYGGTELIRYPTDTHDFFWHPEGVNSELLTLTTSPLEILSTTRAVQGYGVPSAVMQTAVTTFGEDLITRYLPEGWPGIEFWQLQTLNIYWTELNSSTGNETRKFNFSLPCLPDIVATSLLNGSFLSSKVYWIWDVLISSTGPNNTLILGKINPASTLGPVLSAMELYTKSGLRLLRTDDQDALAIENIKSTFALTEWTGDPCLPYPHPWVTCSNSHDPTAVNPTIIALNLSGYNFGGTISQISTSLIDLSSLTSLSLDDNNFMGPLPDLSFLTNLITLNLGNNNLSGPLPDWLTSLQHLRHLSVEKNNFDGLIPALLLSSDTLDFTYRPGNPLLTGGVQLQDSNESSKSSSSHSLAILGATLGSVLGIVLLSIMAYFLYPWLKLNLANVYKVNNSEIEGASGAKSYTLAEVTAMTRNFNTEIGRGGFGPVYYGKLPDGHEVAVKVADGSTRQGKREFFNEVDVLSRVRHKNLVALVGYCQEDKQQILIYEYMKNGSVHDQLFGNTLNSLGKLLDWKMRLQIAINAAQGLEYLHTGCSPSFIHRDIKSSNILLSAKYDAKVADFGLTKLMGDAEDTKVLTLVMGTAGYLDPEYYHTHYLSTKSDIYSFGVVLLELLTGRPPISRSMSSASSKSNTNLCDWVRAGLEDGSIEAILDPAVRASLPTPNQDALWKVTEIALQCVEPKSIHRPTMTTVLQELHLAANLEDPTSSGQDELSFGPFDYSGSEMAPMAR